MWHGGMHVYARHVCVCIYIPGPPPHSTKRLSNVAACMPGCTFGTLPDILHLVHGLSKDVFHGEPLQFVCVIEMYMSKMS